MSIRSLWQAGRYHPKITILILILVGASAYYFWQRHYAAHPAFPPMPVEVSSVQLKDIRQTLDTVGSLEANESVIIRPEVAGRIIGLGFEEGHRVEQGQILFSLEDSVQQATVKQAEAQYDLSKLEFQRMMDLVKKGVGSIEQRDTAQATLKTNEAGLAEARSVLNKMRILAPFSGIIGLRSVSIGDYVQVNQTLVKLVDLDHIKVNFQVPEVYLTKLERSHKIDFRVDAFPDKQFQGEIYAIEPEIDVTSRNILVKARLPNPGNILRSGLFAKIALIVYTKPNAIMIPEAAIFYLSKKPFVYQVVNQQAKSTPVELGIRDGTWLEVLKGLEPNAQVVTAGHLKIQDGSPVQPIPSSDKST